MMIAADIISKEACEQSFAFFVIFLLVIGAPFLLTALLGRKIKNRPKSWSYPVNLLVNL